MNYRVAALCTLSLVATASRAQQQDASLRYYCEEGPSRIVISESGAASGQSKGKVEWIDPGDLIQYTKEDERGDVRRTGSTFIARRCGRLTIKVSGGYFNANPQGEMGAADDYAIVEILDDSGLTTGLLAIGNCIPSISRYSFMVECPKDWVIQLEVSQGGQGMVIRTPHDLEELRQPVKAPALPPSR